MNRVLYNKCLSIIEKNNYKQNLNQSFDLIDFTHSVSNHLPSKFIVVKSPSISSLDRLQLLNSKTYQTPSFFSMSQTTTKIGYRYGIHLYFPIQEWIFESSRSLGGRNEGKGQKPKQTTFLCRKKIKLFYGALHSKKLQKIIEQAAPKQSNFAKNFFSLIESRLDVILYRSDFAKTIKAARQAIRHSKVYVNGRCCRIPSTLCKPGDIVSLKKNNVDQGSRKHSISVHLNKGLINKVVPLEKKNIVCKLLLFALICLKRIRNQLDVFEISNINKIANSKKRLIIASQKNQEIKYFQKSKLDLILNYLEKQEQNKFSSILWNNAISSFGTQLELYSPIISGNIQNSFFAVSDKEKIFLNPQNVEKKPTHLEISRISNNIIFLYSPQKISLPFYIDVDILRKI